MKIIISRAEYEAYRSAILAIANGVNISSSRKEGIALAMSDEIINEQIETFLTKQYYDVQRNEYVVDIDKQKLITTYNLCQQHSYSIASVINIVMNCYNAYISLINIARQSFMNTLPALTLFTNAVKQEFVGENQDLEPGELVLDELKKIFIRTAVHS